MRVLALCFEDVFHPTGGMGVHCRDLYKALGRSGVESTLITIASVEPAEGEYVLAENVRVLKITNTHSFQSNVPLLFHFLLEHNFLVNILDRYGRERFDLIHVHDSHLWSVAEALQALWRIPIVLTSHLSPLLHEMRYSTDMLARYKNQLEGSSLIGADAVITVSRYYQQRLRESLLEIDATMIPNGVDMESLASYSRNDAIRSRYGCDDGRKLVVLVGRPVGAKGIELFLDAAAATPECSFVLVAFLPETVERFYPLADRIQQAEQGGNFKWERYISHEDKYKLMASADVGCVPSLYEPFGIVALEWMALGVPLVTTACGGLAEFCTPDNSTIIEPTAGALAEAVLGTRRDEQRLTTAKHTAEAYSWESTALKTKQVYEEVLRHA